MEANSTGGQGSRRAVAPSDDDGDEYTITYLRVLVLCRMILRISYSNPPYNTRCRNLRYSCFGEAVASVLTCIVLTHAFSQFPFIYP
jgi:hypothetical protein